MVFDVLANIFVARFYDKQKWKKSFFFGGVYLAFGILLSLFSILLGLKEQKIVLLLGLPLLSSYLAARYFLKTKRAIMLAVISSATTLLIAYLFLNYAVDLGTLSMLSMSVL